MYTWSHRIKIQSFHPEAAQQLSRKKLVVQTELNDWINTDQPVIVIFSIHSAFHEGIKGEVKVHGFMSAIKEHIHGPITLLMTEKAHVNVLSMRFNNDVAKAYQQCLEDAYQLANRYHPFFSGCKIEYWHSFVDNDPEYARYKHVIRSLAHTDTLFQELLYADARATYTPAMEDLYPDKNTYISKTIEDLLEQCIYLLVAKRRGYTFDFYPGKHYQCTEYINYNVHPLHTLQRIVVNVKLE